MIAHKQVPSKRNNTIFTLAVLLLVLGGAAFYVGSNDRVIRSLGAIACVVSVYLIRKSRGQSQYASADTTGQQADSETAGRPGRLMWALGVLSLILIGVSCFLLRSDAAHGYHQIWPVYLFFGTIVVCGLFLSYLVAKMM